MAKTQQGQPAAQKPATEHESAFLKSNAVLINETAKIYGLADKATPEDKAKVREGWKAALKDGDGWRIIKNHFGMCVILHGFEGRLFEAIYDSHLAKQTGRFAEAMRNVARLVDFRVDKFAPFVAEQLVDAFYEKFGNSSRTSAAGDLLAAMQQTELSWNPDVQTLEYWVESSARRSANRTERSAKTQTAITEALNEGEGVGGVGSELTEPTEPEPKPEPRVELTSKLEAARARKVKAVESEDFAAAKAAKDEIVQLESELATLDQPKMEAIFPTTAPAYAPVPVAAVPATTPTPASAPTVTAQPAPASTGNGEATFLTAIEAFKKEVRDTKPSAKLSKELKAGFLNTADKFFAEGNVSGLEPMRSRFRSLLT
ncbi:MAG: hypothetical protein HYX20_01715 [Candidatus Yanofskybacteria bacterium]|nr:hypothetical protein [Candidatus Yanofskybacteria bacterium]